MQRRLILASSSPYRKALLQQLRLPFNCQSPDIDETRLEGESAEQLVERLAINKARAIALQHSEVDALIIGSDQVAVLDGNILTKPGNHQNACQQLQQCSGKSVRFLTGLCLYNSQTAQYQYATEVFTVHFRTLSAHTIEQYLQTEQPYDCAGSFKVEGLGICLFERLEGDDPNTLVGLPLIRLIDFLAQENTTLFSHVQS